MALPSFMATQADILRPFILPAVMAVLTLQHNFAALILFNDIQLLRYVSSVKYEYGALVG
jgi:hypothetical protein